MSQNYRLSLGKIKKNQRRKARKRDEIINFNKKLAEYGLDMGPCLTEKEIDEFLTNFPPVSFSMLKR